jgi:uncharacterized protein YegL
LNELDYIGIDAYFPLSDTTPSVLELNDAWQQQLKNRKPSRNEQKILFTEFGYRNSDQAKEPWTESENTINNQAQVNAYESLFQTLTQKNGLREDLPGNGMQMIITNAKKQR